MSIDNAPVLGLLKSTMGWLTERQKVLAQNVANANTPNYTPRDISQGAFEKALAQSPRGSDRTALLATTSDRHFATPERKSTFAPQALKAADAPDSDTTINGNSVVLEDQMMKVAETRMHYEAAIGLYQKSLNLIRMAARPPGR